MVNLWEIVKPEDLDISVSFGFICRGTLKSFCELRQIIQEFFKGKTGEFLVYSKASGNLLKIIKTEEEGLKINVGGNRETERRRRNFDEKG